MREMASREKVARFLKELGRQASAPGKIFLTGGACAVLLGWRRGTLDVDIRLVPDQDKLLQEIPRLKETLQLNVELACPSDFIPELPDWESRSPFICQEGKLAVFHYDFYAQALSKIERGHKRDDEDVKNMIESGHVDPKELLAYFEKIEPLMYKYPALDPKAFRAKVEQRCHKLKKK